MPARLAARWVSVPFIVLAALALGAAAASCGGAGGASLFSDGGGGGSSGSGDGSAASSGGGDDATTGGNEGGFGMGDSGKGGSCKPKTCAQQGFGCGMQGDGCGDVIDCGTCASPQTCGGGGVKNQCGGKGGIGNDGGPVCTPTTCSKLGYTCGTAGDGCGGLLQCGTCTGGLVCGAQMPYQCGGGVSCTGLCQQQAACDAGTPTTITGRVVAGTIPTYGTPDPVPNVLVYVPNAPLQAFTPGAQCGCPPVTGNPLVWTTTAVDGTFTLKNVPVGTNIPIVIQLGRWRRETSFNSPAACATGQVVDNNAGGAAAGDIHMPRTHTDGLNNQADIPLTALSTGSVDAMECVLLKMGVDQSEFSDPAAATNGQRIHLYVGNGANASNGTTQETTLTSSLTTMMKYDQVLFPCWGSPVDKNPTDLSNTVMYTSAGGRMFATHYSYTWLYTTSPYNMTATWNPDSQYTQVTGDIDTSFPRGATFGQWMTIVGAATGTPPAFPITSPRQDFVNPVPPSLRYVYANDPANGNYPLHYTFDMPWQSNNTCGRVIYSDFHVADLFSTGNFPTECDTTPLNPQEKALEYTIWDLGQCLTPQVPTCTPLTCAQQNISCGPAGDGCGNEIMCGNCPSPQTCGGGGVPGKCGYPEGGACVPETCQQLGVACGPAGDGCGGLLQCGTCQAPQTCGGGGTPGQCGGGVQ